MPYPGEFAYNQPPPQQYQQQYNQPQYNQQQYNQPQFNQPQFNQPQFNQPQFNQPQYPQQQQYQQFQQFPPPAQQWQSAPMSVAPPPGAFRPSHLMQHAGNSQAGFNFQLSTCTGKRKALLIGINYAGSSNALKGCHNDALNMKRFIIDRFQYKPEDIVVLLDTPSGNYADQPTRANIERACAWLVSNAGADDSLVFHYSGHGTQVRDTSGDEDDGHDEAICPLDFKQAGVIIDDQMHDMLVRPLPPGCRLTAIFDSCHSGSSLDLPYMYGTNGKLKEPNLLAEAGQGLLGAAGSYMKGDIMGAVTGLGGLLKSAMNQNSGASDRNKMTKTSPADVIMFSGCKDSQTSADANISGNATGAMSYAFIAALSKYKDLTYNQLLNAIRDELVGKYAQKPQLSC